METAAESEGSVSLRERVLGRIREERERAEKATPGPWAIAGGNDADDYPTLHVFGVARGPHYHAYSLYAGASVGYVRNECDADSITSARTLLPALLAEAQRQVEEHEPRRCMWGSHDVCTVCANHESSARCPVVLAWARVFGEGE